jgi:hypothetical protein
VYFFAGLITFPQSEFSTLAADGRGHGSVGRPTSGEVIPPPRHLTLAWGKKGVKKAPFLRIKKDLARQEDFCSYFRGWKLIGGSCFFWVAGGKVFYEQDRHLR